MITFAPDHNLTLADLNADQILPIVHAWTALYTSHVSKDSPLAQAIDKMSLPAISSFAQVPRPKSQYRWMQIFENKGAAMGCSNPHPHGQVWTTTGLPEEPLIEMAQLMQYGADHSGENLLVDYAQLEGSDPKKERVVYQNAVFLVVCPWWAVWPFETMILPKTHKRALVDFTNEERILLAEAISEVTRRYDNLFETHFPYSMGMHQAPLVEERKGETEASQFHMHFYPPLLRSASVRKFLVG